MNKAGLCINAESAIWRSRSSYHKTNRHFLVPTMTTSAANTRTINSAHDICVRGIHNNNTKTRFAFAELTRRQRREKIQTQKAVRGKQTKSLRAGEPDRLDKQRRYFSPAQFPPETKTESHCRSSFPSLPPLPSCPSPHTPSNVNHSHPPILPRTLRNCQTRSFAGQVLLRNISLPATAASLFSRFLSLSPRHADMTGSPTYANLIVFGPSRKCLRGLSDSGQPAPSNASGSPAAALRL